MGFCSCDNEDIVLFKPKLFKPERGEDRNFDELILQCSFCCGRELFVQSATFGLQFEVLCSPEITRDGLRTAESLAWCV